MALIPCTSITSGLNGQSCTANPGGVSQIILTNFADVANVTLTGGQGIQDHGARKSERARILPPHSKNDLRRRFEGKTYCMFQMLPTVRVPFFGIHTDKIRLLEKLLNTGGGNPPNTEQRIGFRLDATFSLLSFSHNSDMRF